jgi:hypothetical protein
LTFGGTDCYNYNGYQVRRGCRTPATVNGTLEDEMRRVRDTVIVGVIVLNSVVFSAQGAAVSGHTYYAGTTIPLSGVLVRIEGITSTTGGNGAYVLPGVPVGWRTITAMKSSYDDYSESVNIPEQGLTKNIEMTAQTPRTLSGTVYDGQDPPQTLAGATVAVLNPDGFSSGLTDTTDFTGHYQISNVPQQSIQVQFSKPAYDTKTPTIAMANYDKVYNEQLLMSSIAPPSDLAATVNWQQVTLSWTGRPESTLKGYNLYRSSEPSSGYRRINSTLVFAGTNNYRDALPDNNVYYYKIASVNNEDKAVPLSNSIRVVPPSSGHVTSDTAWSGTVQITEDVTIDEGTRLTILPGTVVKFKADSPGGGAYNPGLFVNGTLDAQGTEYDMIIFTSASSEPSPGDWKGIAFRDSSNDLGCIIGYCTIEYAISGISCYDSSPSIRHNIIRNNAVDEYLRGDHWDSSGGGIFCGNSSAKIVGNVISNNTAGGDGGGIYCSNSPCEIRNNIINNNTAYGGGGGGIACSGSSPDIVGNTIYGNTSGFDGGGMYCDTCAPDIVDNVIYQNTVPWPGKSGGGGITCYNSTPKIINCTVYNNVGAGINSLNGCAEVANSVLWGNTDDLLWYPPYIGCSASYSNIGDADSGTGNISSLPMFVDPAIGDFHLQSSSPCIDAGDNGSVPNGITVDLDGRPRFIDDPLTPDTGNGTAPIVDMGAYEFQGSTTKSLARVEIQGDAEVDESSGAPYLCIAYYDDGTTSNVTPGTAWSENSPYTTIGGTGYVTTSAVPTDQSCRITASYQGKSDTRDVTILNVVMAPSVQSLEISGPTQVNEGFGAQYTCTAHYDNGGMVDVTSSATWSENSSYASINSSGYVSASSVTSDQPCQITATYEGKTDTLDVTIKNVPVVTSVEISGPAQVNEGTGAQYTCTAHYDNGSTADVTSSAAWSENSSYASINSGGHLSASSVTSDQPCQVTATYESKSDTFDLTIKNVPVVTSVEISGPTQVNESSGAQYTCTAHYDNGSTADVTGSAVWSENSNYAGISGGGYLTTSAVDSDQPCRITATYDGESATHDVTLKASLQWLSCDWNGDGIVSIIGDVPPFVDCVYFGNCPDWPQDKLLGVGDCNYDGILSIIGDVPCFVNCVYFGNCE